MKRADLLTITVYASALRLIGQVVAFISGLAISTNFGATNATDNYYAALILPAALANLVINILTNLFAPIYLKSIHDDPAQRQPILGSLSFVTTVALALGILISFSAVPVSTTLRGLQSNELIIQASILGTVLIALTPLIGFTRLLSVICEAHGCYTIPGTAALLNSLVFVLVLVFTVQPLGIYSLLCANLSGQIAELLALAFYTRRNLQISLRPNPQLHTAVREMLVRSVAPAVTYIALFFVPTFDRAAAAALNAGSLTAFHYGERVVTVFDVIVMGSAITVISNLWAQRSATHGIQAISRTFGTVISHLLFVLVPLSLGGFVLSRPIISVLFGHGLFTADATSAQVFGILLLSAPFNYLIVLIVRFLLILKDVRAQVILSIGISALNTFLNILFAPRLGLTGIALSTLLSRLLILTVSYSLLRHRLPQIHIRAVLPNFVRTILSAVVMLSSLWLMYPLFSPALSRDFGLTAQILALGALVVAGGSIYLYTAWLTRHPDLIILLQVITERLALCVRSSRV